MANFDSYEAYTFDDGSGVKTIHCTDHGQPWAHTNPHIHDEPGAGLSFVDAGFTYEGRRVVYARSRPVEGGHMRSRPLTWYEEELLAAMRE